MASYTEKAAARQREIERRRREREQTRQNRNAAVEQSYLTATLQRRANKQQFRSDVADGLVENTVENRRNYVRRMPDSTIAAMSAGESKRQYADKRQEYMTNQAQRDLMADQGYAAGRTADAQYLQAGSIVPSALIAANAQGVSDQYRYMTGVMNDATTRRGQDLGYTTANLDREAKVNLSEKEIDAQRTIAQQRAMYAYLQSQMEQDQKPRTIDYEYANKHGDNKIQFIYIPGEGWVSSEQLVRESGAFED